MPPNHSRSERQSYQGRSFRGQDLAGSDFSDADIRGADFSQANLTDANFQGTIAGLQLHWQISIVFVSAVLSGLFAYLAVFAGFWLAFQLTLAFDKLPTTATFFSLVLIAFLVITSYRGLLNAIVSIPIAVAVIIPISGIVTAAGSGHPTAASTGAGIAAIAFAGAIGVTIATITARIATTLKSIGISFATALIGVFLAVQSGQIESVSTAGNAAANAEQVSVSVQMSLLSGIVLLGVSLFLTWKTLAQGDRYRFIIDFAITVTTLKGTRFQSANLTDANFSGARLKNANFSNAKITRTDWRDAFKLEWAKVNHTILTDPKVQNLLTRGKRDQTIYRNVNLRGANLRGFDLSSLNLRGANLSEATFQGACLESANLAQTQAIDTDFTNAQMTGVCGLGSWNINETTQLENIDCGWVYLLETPKPQTDDRERRPSSGEFLPGEFTALFRAAIDTVDLIFRNGLQWSALTQSLQNTQLQHSLLEIRSIENKGNGIVVVKLNVSSDANKSQIHQQFMQFYETAIALEAEQNQRLEAHEQELRSMRSVLDRLTAQPTSEDVVLLNISNGNFDRGFPVTLQILKGGNTLPIVQRSGQLSSHSEMVSYYQAWRSAYRQALQFPRLEVPNQITNVGQAEIVGECFATANRLRTELNHWLKAESFAAIEREMYIHLALDRPIRVILQTQHPHLRQLPWQAWEFLQRYPCAEIALSSPEYNAPTTSMLAQPRHAQVKILAVLGESQGLDLQNDRASLQALDTEVTFLVEPTKHCLRTYLWQQNWDILFFAGHSQSNPDATTASLQLNQTEKLDITELRNSLKTAIEHGLKLAIFNSCDGLGLATLFTDLQMPQLIVMREPVSDIIAHTFLVHFLNQFSSGHSLYQSVRAARERLQDLEPDYFCASWLPSIIQNPSASPLTWQDFNGS